jgi:hypothetical protein
MTLEVSIGKIISTGNKNNFKNRRIIIHRQCDLMDGRMDADEGMSRA